jgi:hypothetical protein
MAVVGVEALHQQSGGDALPDKPSALQIRPGWSG